MAKTTAVDTYAADFLQRESKRRESMSNARTAAARRLALRLQHKAEQRRWLENVQQCERMAFMMVDRTMAGHVHTYELRACINHVQKILRRAAGRDVDDLRDWLVALTQTMPHLQAKRQLALGLAHLPSTPVTDSDQTSAAIAAKPSNSAMAAKR